MEILRVAKRSWSTDKRLWLGGGAFITLYALLLLIPPGVDWVGFREAVQHWQMPYAVKGFYNPPWLLPLIAPLAVLPPRLGQATNSLLALTIMFLVIRHFGGKALSVMVAMLAPPTLFLLMNGNVEWLVLAGLLLPAPAGILLLSLKPQSGGGMIVLHIKCSPRPLLLLAPTAIIAGSSFLIWGWWPRFSSRAVDLSWNMSIWPWGLLLGIPILVLALKEESEELALSCMPFLSPYCGLIGWLIPFTVLAAKLPRATLISIVALWLIISIRIIG